MSHLIEELNKRGLHPIASPMPAIKRIARNTSTLRSVKSHRRGSVFQLAALHRAEIGEATLKKTLRGFYSAKSTTIAHAPSMYYWLLERAGICFAETQQLVQQRRLVVDGVTVDKLSDLEHQMDWDVFAKMNVVLKMPQAQSAGTHDAATSGPWKEVPVLKRALHRSYSLMCMDSSVLMTSEVSEPRSFVHRLARHPPQPARGARLSSSPLTDSVSRVGLNILRPCGFVNRMVNGLVLVTNDVSAVRYWNNEYLGNFGVYDVRFPRGAPNEVYDAALKDCSETLTGVRNSMVVASLSTRCTARLEQLPAALQGRFDAATALDTSLRQGDGRRLPLDTTQRLVLETPLLPFRLLSRLRRNGAVVTCVKQGPFSLTSSLTSSQVADRQRLMTVEELVAAFEFEKRMKSNRLVLTLTSFDDAGDSDPFADQSN